MDQDGAVGLDQQEPGGKGKMGFEPANVINRASGYDKSHAVQTTVWSGGSLPRGSRGQRLCRGFRTCPEAGKGGWHGRGWGRMEACRVPTDPAVQCPEKPGLVPAGRPEEKGAVRYPSWTWSGRGQASPAGKAPPTANGWSAP